MADHYTINLRGGKYTVINRFGQPLEFRRYGEDWPGAGDLRFTNVVIAMADRIQELEEAVKAVLDGSLDKYGRRENNGMLTPTARFRQGADPYVAAWSDQLRKVLTQGEQP